MPITETLGKIDEGFKLIGVIEHELGMLLSILKQDKEYKILGTHVSTWKEALKELGLTYSKAQLLIDTYETFPLLESFINYDRLKDIGRLFKFGIIKSSDLEEIKEKAQTLTIKDWIDEKNMIEGKSSYLTCEHKNYDLYAHCKDCGRWIKQ